MLGWQNTGFQRAKVRIKINYNVKATSHLVKWGLW
jgi:hypothetical protein